MVLPQVLTALLLAAIAPTPQRVSAYARASGSHPRLATDTGHLPVHLLPGLAVHCPGNWRQRDLPFHAGTMAAYGMTKVEALSSITLNAAKILGIADRTGSIEAGKDANIIISTGDVLDMRSSVLTHAFIQGRNVNLDNKHSQLFERYKYKYNLK